MLSIFISGDKFIACMIIVGGSSGILLGVRYFGEKRRLDHERYTFFQALLDHSMFVAMLFGGFGSLFFGSQTLNSYNLPKTLISVCQNFFLMLWVYVWATKKTSWYKYRRKN